MHKGDKIMSIFDIFKKKNNQVEVEYSEKYDSSMIKEKVLDLVKKGIVMEPDDSLNDLKKDVSKIGGNPCLPADFAWPTFKSHEDNEFRPLSFFCQLNLSELAAFDTENLLPEKGMLSFFYECESFCCGFDPEDKGAARIFYFEDLKTLVPTDVPSELEEEYIIPEIGVKFKTVNTYPSFTEFEIHTDMECEWDTYEKVLEDIGENTDDNMDCHKILGYADVIQDEMLTECERIKRGLYCGDHESYESTPDDVAADIKNEAKEWIMLLQLSTIEKNDFEWMFGDCGMLYYYIRKEDLIEKNFDNMWFSVQCC